MRELARERVEFARRHGWSGPPFNILQLASLLGIKHRPVEGIEQDALIMPIGDRFEIRWNASVVEARRNFTFGHEVSHTFFPDCAEAIRFRQPTHRCDPGRPVEVLCDVGASELLLPLAEFIEDLGTRGVAIETIDALRARYSASWPAVARRVIQVTDERSAIAFLTLRLSKREAEKAAQQALVPEVIARPKYRVDSMFVSLDFGASPLPPHKSVPDTSCLYRVSSTRVVRAIEGWQGGRERLPDCEVEALALPPDSAGRSRAIAILKRC